MVFSRFLLAARPRLQAWQVAAIGASGLSGSALLAEYRPPPRSHVSFLTVSKLPPRDEGLILAQAVQQLDVQAAQSILAAWPQGAALIDPEDNTLFHLVATESDRYTARPEAAKEMVSLLLKHGWSVVDMKNKVGLRAENVAQQLAPRGLVTQLLRQRARDFQEPSLAEKPLTLIGQLSPVPWLWQYVLQDERHRSFAAVFKGAFTQEQRTRWAEAAMAADWIALPGVPRKVSWYVSQECADCPYRYSGLEYPATVFPPFMEELREEVCKICGIPKDQYPNSCNVNVYEDQNNEVGWHSDDEVMFQALEDDTQILSFSLGEARDFCWRMQGTDQTVGCMSLGDGDVMTMEGLFQKHYKHSVPPSDKLCGWRINFTFRWIKVKAHAADALTKGIQSK